jgi:hypothetical protein
MSIYAGQEYRVLLSKDIQSYPSGNVHRLLKDNIIYIKKGEYIHPASIKNKTRTWCYDVRVIGRIVREEFSIHTLILRSLLNDHFIRRNDLCPITEHVQDGHPGQVYNEYLGKWVWL